jgi:hypothetical protein
VTALRVHMVPRVVTELPAREQAQLDAERARRGAVGDAGQSIVLQYRNCPRVWSVLHARMCAFSCHGGVLPSVHTMG